MRPLFTVNAGEYLAGNELERRGFVVWIPSKDTGVDLLLSDRRLKRVVPIQVKISRDFSLENSLDLHERLYAAGFFSTRLSKIQKSPATYWMLGIVKQALKEIDWVIIPPKKLYLKLIRTHGKQDKIQHFFVWVSEKRRCWEANGLSRADQRSIARDQFSHGQRDLTPYLNSWKLLSRELR